MTHPALADHLAGGYFLVLASAGPPPWLPKGSGVTRAISASEELVAALPRPTWTGDFDTIAAQFGIDGRERDAAGKHADELFERGLLGWPNVFFERSDAVDFRRRFIPARSDVVLLGIGLVDAQATTLIDEGGTPSGVRDRLQRRVALEEPGGRALGYELLGLDVPPMVSWAVNYLPAVVEDRLGIRVNKDGLITSFDDACAAAELISRPEAPSEPVPFRPWLLVEYS